MTIFCIHLGRMEVLGTRPEDREQLIALRDLWEERAAILEYEAGFTKIEAEHHAWLYLVESITDMTQPGWSVGY